MVGCRPPDKTGVLVPLQFYGPEGCVQRFIVVGPNPCYVLIEGTPRCNKGRGPPYHYLRATTVE